MQEKCISNKQNIFIITISFALICSFFVCGNEINITMGDYNFITYIAKIGKVQTDDLPLFKDCREFLNEKIVYWIRQLIREAEDRLGDRKTITDKDVDTAICTLVRVPDRQDNKLAQIFREIGTEYASGESDYKTDLYIPFARLSKCAKNNIQYKDTKISKKALIYLLAVVEQIILEFVQAGYDVYQKKDKKSKSLGMKHINVALENDLELQNL